MRSDSKLIIKSFEDSINKVSMNLKGIPISSGKCLAKAWVYKKRIDVNKTNIPEEKIQYEIERLEKAIELTKQDILNAQHEAKIKHGDKYAAIFDSHLLMLSDPQFKPKIIKKIQTEKINVESVVKEIVDEIHAKFLKIQDPYLRERAIDIKDVGDKLLRHLSGYKSASVEFENEDFILVAEDLTPTELIEFSKQRLAGLCLDSGGTTSHVAILANALGIPAVFGLINLSQVAHTGDLIFIDAFNEGNVVLNPSEEIIKFTMLSCTDKTMNTYSTENHTNKAILTKDNFRINLAANIVRIEELKYLAELNIKRIGLFRSEFIFMESLDLPSEQYQEQIYKQVVDASSELTVLRILDIGSDKPLKYLPLPTEANPAIGYRSIRFLLSREDILLPQLKAMIKAGDGKNCKILFPMVSTLSELVQINNLYQKALDIVQPQNPPSWGIMLEVPSIAFMLEQVAKYTNFISIGTNDLMQFFYAVDRTNERLNYYTSALTLPFLRFLYYIVSTALAEGLTVSTCGELASSVDGFIALVGLGLQDISVRPNAIGKIKKIIPLISRSDVVEFIQSILISSDVYDVKPLIQKNYEFIREYH